MTAFGPYKRTETIDFAELDTNNLFVIAGNTGAGKTTIFDGICFALYGSASGSDREDHRMLRSDFADDDTHTSVELEFELKGRTYRILRQLGHVKQGNKTKTGERYEFYEKWAAKKSHVSIGKWFQRLIKSLKPFLASRRISSSKLSCFPKESSGNY